MVPETRIEVLRDVAARADGRWVLYWMVAARRPTYNPGLQRAVELAQTHGKPLVILEALRCGYRWASHRLHRFVLDGMAANAEAFAPASVTYYPYVEPEHGAGKGLLARFAKDAVAVVTDTQPGFFLPRMQAAAMAQVRCRFERIDSLGLLPLSATEAEHKTAHSFRRYLQKTLPLHLPWSPAADPLVDSGLPRLAALPDDLTARWPAAAPSMFRGDRAALASLPIDDQVGVTSLRGGTRAAQLRWRHFLQHDLDAYGDGRNHPDDDRASGLSPYLHFGHISAHQIFDELAADRGWSMADLGAETKGSRHGWWGLSESVESFLDEVITWRELGQHFCHHRGDYDQYNSLPEWALTTLEQHASDPRPYLPTDDQLYYGRTSDPIWNAAQRQLLAEGRMHNYLRMLWGKRIFEWSAHPRDAVDRMIELNNRLALDGRNPNSYSGIFWVLGRFDRAWGPVRPIFGKIRYMSSENTKRKLRMSAYLDRWSA